MPDTPPRQVARRPDDGAADIGTLVDLGVVEEQPTPSDPTPPPPDEPTP